MNDRKLIVFTQTFPFGTGEEFFEGELIYLCKYFDRVVLVPTFAKNLTIKRNVPDNVEIVVVQKNNYSKHKYYHLVKNIQLIFKDVITELINSNYNYRSLLYVLRNSLYSHFLSKLIKDLEGTEPCIMYSYWMNANAVAISQLKRKRQLKSKFVFRTHGGDLYNDRQLYGYLPFRHLCYRYADCVVAISRHGYDYIVNNFDVERSKVVISYLGVEDNGIGPLNKSLTLKVVSCSSIIPLKRIEKIIDVLANFSIETEWLHIGSGFECDKVVTYADKKLPSHVTHKFLGAVSNSEVTEFFKNNSVDFFINLSLSEGLPVSMMEAISFGIPVVGNNTGGVREIVNSKTGLLFTLEEDVNTIALSIQDESFLSKIKDIGFRTEVRDFWRHNFFSAGNYNNFINEVLSVKDIQSDE